MKQVWKNVISYTSASLIAGAIAGGVFFYKDHGYTAVHESKVVIKKEIEHKVGQDIYYIHMGDTVFKANKKMYVSVEVGDTITYDARDYGYMGFHIDDYVVTKGGEKE
jgi:hypothetical protein